LPFRANGLTIPAKSGGHLTRTIRAAVASGALKAVTARGGSNARVLAAAGLEAADLDDPDRLIDLESILRLSCAAAEEARNDAFGLHAGETWSLSALGVLTYAVLNAPTVGTALRNLDRYGRSHLQGGGIRFASDGGEARLGYELAVADRELARQHVEAAAVVGVRIVRRLAGDDWRPRRVLFGHRRPRDVCEHERIFACPLSFGQETNLSIVFDAAVLAKSVRGADRRLLPLVERHLEEVLAKLGDDHWLQGVRGTIAEALCDGGPTLRVIAKRMGMSVRTLQRRLDDHGVLFKALVAEIRGELARRYLAEGRANLTEVAFLLGYSELSGFDRAFRRWTGSTPLEARKNLRSAPAS
jgi:AraC-like DNA-binding protein